MTVTVVFAGPTIAADEIRARLPHADVRPPAARGDVYRAALAADRIGLIDGVFESVPSVWHKEVLFALEQGVRCFGSSSMGALRAAELDGFGMRGVGRIYEGVAAGRFDDDDVAVAHAPESYRYKALSVPLVNLHFTLEAAVDAGVLGQEIADEVRALQKRRFYRDRSMRSIRDDLESAGAETDVAEALLGGVIDQKHRDALELLDAVALSPDGRDSQRIRVTRTVFFDRMVAEEHELAAHGAVDQWSHSVLEELRLDPDRYRRIESIAVRAGATRELARYSGFEIDQQFVDDVSDELRRELGLLESPALDAWLDEVGLGLDGYAGLIDRRARARVGDALLPLGRDDDLLDAVRLAGLWPELAERARRKSSLDREHAGDESGAGLDPTLRTQAIDWWCAEHLSRNSDEVDLGAMARSLGFADVHAFTGAVLREYRHVKDGASGG